ncbi:hypothetical protein GCK72_018395 [Caenorhabditis remanei]|uniref:DUF7622 domain-containing protein n=1 Tax=Caenorhabditis remanei TaxID=31234 RepID=A0A6A5GAM7_CAERE|nr:hypothetical protein GCK72_018395 [Caenorhabditis remanei]KAF1751841.1 hypothetical protein GCK72_018395 [Caenorhabditis remanei]
MLFLSFIILVSNAVIVTTITCFNCESDFQGALRCQQPCEGSQCVVWKWNSRSELAIKQGCLQGVDKQWTAKVGCRTNHLGASLCVCDDGPLCNRVERAEQTARPLPQIRLPAVECQSKVISSGFVGPRREKVCTSNYCHVTKTETFAEEEGQNSDVLSVSNCGDLPEFDFDVRLKNSIGFQGLYSNGCYRIQVEKRSAMVDCVCSKNKCNEVIPEIETGHVRCYMGKDFRNTSQVDSHEFCDGDFCLIQDAHGRVSKGCISLNERNSWSHLKSGHRRILGVEQWLCQAHLCNYDTERAMKSVRSMRAGKTNSGSFFNFSVGFLTFLIVLVSRFLLI